MIKNILYSLFLHSLLLLLLYANFNLKNSKENKPTEISVSLISMSGSQDPKQNKPTPINTNEVEKKVEEKPKEVLSKAAKSPKESTKNKVATPPKRSIKPKLVKSADKMVTKEKPKLIKEAEKPEEKPQENSKDEKEEIQQPEEKIIETPKKEQDLGSEKQAEQKQDSDNKKESEQKVKEEKQAPNIDNLDLSAREKFNIQSQLKRCYSRAISENKDHKNKTKILVQVLINEDGVIESDFEEAIDLEKYNNPKETDYKIAVDNARRAIDLCSPIRNLPIDKYDIWKEVMLEFGDE